uniref:Crossover junction endonuclease MUS81 n=1 Tax=Oryzias melastigma TaxID=30732 RepID=A0A3B3CZT4_ORYME
MPSSGPVRFGRKRALPPCPNPLFLQWLTELRDEAKEKGLKIQYTYQKAINSLNKYPLPLQNAREAKILQNFGDGICRVLEEKLQRYYREEGPRPLRTAQNRSSQPGGGYVPQRRSGGHAVLLALYRQSQVRWCGPPPPGADLVSDGVKNLLLKTHSPARYSLTDEGLALARRLAAVEEEAGPGGGGEDGRNESVTQSEDVGSSSAEPQDSRTTSRTADVLAPGSYEILLCVDFIETTGQHRKQELVKELQRNGVHFDVRKLNVGDFLWVAREKMLRAPAGRELVLDYIIERKRMDDLCGSIIDGRFREQKFRLKRCGLRKPIYLVEGGTAAASHLSLPEATLQQAIVNTQVGGASCPPVRDESIKSRFVHCFSAL